MLAQDYAEIEVVVNDDASNPPATVPDDPRVRLLRSDANVGLCRSRNIAIAAARGRFITFLDDDDVLTPNAVANAHAAFEKSGLPQPVGVLSAMEVVDSNDRLIELRLPPTLPRGNYYSLETIDPRFSLYAKQTLFIEIEVMRRIGGWDEAFVTRGTSELFFRLNPARSTRYTTGRISTISACGTAAIDECQPA